MYKLNKTFSDDEKMIITKGLGKNYSILNQIESECFILCKKGEYFYNDCFSPENREFFMRQQYRKANPNRIIRFYHYFLMDTIEVRGDWYRGRQDENGNFEFDTHGGDLEYTISTL